MTIQSSSGDETDDYADFTIASVNNAANSDQAGPADKNPTPFSRNLNRTKSTSSFLIHPQRKSSIIVAATGEKIQRTYSTWEQLSTSSTATRPAFSVTPLVSSEEESALNLHQQSSFISSITRSYTYLTSYIKHLITKPITKAAIAYFLASLTVYSPQFRTCWVLLIQSIWYVLLSYISIHPEVLAQ